MAAPLGREVTAVFNRVLAITEHVLSWDFLPKHNILAVDFDQYITRLQ